MVKSWLWYRELLHVKGWWMAITYSSACPDNNVKDKIGHRNSRIKISSNWRQAKYWCSAVATRLLNVKAFIKQKSEIWRVQLNYLKLLEFVHEIQLIWYLINHFSSLKAYILLQGHVSCLSLYIFVKIFLTACNDISHDSLKHLLLLTDIPLNQILWRKPSQWLAHVKYFAIHRWASSPDDVNRYSPIDFNEAMPVYDS